VDGRDPETRPEAGAKTDGSALEVRSWTRRAGGARAARGQRNWSRGRRVCTCAERLPMRRTAVGYGGLGPGSYCKLYI
jgi:hypothetical protein